MLRIALCDDDTIYCGKMSNFHNELIMVVKGLKNLENIIVKELPFIYEKSSTKLLEELLTNNEDIIPDGISMINAPFMWSKNITGKNVITTFLYIIHNTENI